MTNPLPSGAKYLITKAVRDQGPLSRADIARLLRMSPSTIGRMVDHLLELDVLRETGARSEEGIGRPSIMLHMNRGLSSVLTIDMRSTRAYAAVTNLGGEILDKRARGLTVGDPNRSIAELTDLVHELTCALGANPPVEVIVVGAPSIVNARTGVIEWAPSLGWKDVPLRRILEDRFEKTVIVENDVNLAVLGEYWKSPGKTQSKNLVFVSVGTGIGAGIVLNGELYRGSTNAAGEVGYFITDAEVLRDNVGVIGNLENRVGSKGLIRSAQLVASRYPASSLAELFNRGQESVHPNEILELALKGDPAALIVFNELVDILTIVICNISVVLDPDEIVLGSPIDLMLPDIIPAIKERIGTALLRPVNLSASQLGTNALILGGAYLALQSLAILRS